MLQLWQALECVRYMWEGVGRGEVNVDIRYFTKLKLASGNAVDCNDRSGMHLKGKDVFF